jgi:hypothetical protein
MTGVLIVFGILAAISLFMFFSKRNDEKAQKKALKKAQLGGYEDERLIPDGAPRKRHELLTLKTGDAVSITGDTYTIEQKLIFREGSFEWVEYKLSDGETTRWLEVEDDDELWLALYQEVDDLKLREAPPAELEYKGTDFELDEKGFATMRKDGEPALGKLPECRYYDYEAEEGDDVLSIEQWGENFEASVGRRVSPHAIEVFPGARG